MGATLQTLCPLLLCRCPSIAGWDLPYLLTSPVLEGTRQRIEMKLKLSRFLPNNELHSSPSAPRILHHLAECIASAQQPGAVLIIFNFASVTCNANRRATDFTGYFYSVRPGSTDHLRDDLSRAFPQFFSHY